MMKKENKFVEINLDDYLRKMDIKIVKGERWGHKFYYLNRTCIIGEAQGIEGWGGVPYFTDNIDKARVEFAVLLSNNYVKFYDEHEEGFRVFFAELVRANS